MNQKTYPGAVPSSVVVMMAAFVAIFFLAIANPAFAASAKKKTPAVERTSAAEHTEARIKQLQDALKITADQQVLWNNLTQVMRENAKEMDDLTREIAENAKPLNAVEQLKIHSQITETQSDQLVKFIPPFEALYASMSDDQKKSTDTLFRTGKHGKHKIK